MDFKTYCDPDTERDIKIRDLHVSETMSVKYYSDVIILPSCNCAFPGFDGEVLFRNGTYVSGVNPNVNYPLPDSINFSMEENQLGEYLTDDNKLIEDTPVIYLGTVIKCWGHYFTDGFSKLWFFFTPEWNKLKQTYMGGVKIVYVSPNIKLDSAPKPWTDLLSILGLDIKLEPINDLKLYKSVYIPDNSLHMFEKHRVYAKEYEQTINKLLDAVKPDGSKKFEKIYLSRKHWIDVNADFGEAPIERLFNKVGYTSVCPEKYSVKEQIAIFKTAKSVVSTSGSLAHNVIFCNNGIELVELRKGMGTPDYQLAINHLKHHKVTFVDCHLTLFVDENVGLGPFYLYVNDNLVRFFKDKFGLVVKKQFNPNLYMKYTRLCFTKDNFFKRHRPYNEYSDFYYKKLTEEMRDKKTIKRRIYDVLDLLGMDNAKRLLKKLYYKITR